MGPDASQRADPVPSPSPADRDLARRVRSRMSRSLANGRPHGRPVLSRVTVPPVDRTRRVLGAPRCPDRHLAAVRCLVWASTCAVSRSTLPIGHHSVFLSGLGPVLAAVLPK